MNGKFWFDWKMWPGRPAKRKKSLPAQSLLRRWTEHAAAPVSALSASMTEIAVTVRLLFPLRPPLLRPSQLLAYEDF